MASGRTQKMFHRPLWPEYRWRKTCDKRLLYLGHRGALYTSSGKRVGKFSSPEELPHFLEQENAYAFAKDLSVPDIYRHIPAWAADSHTSLLGSKKGRFLAARFSKRNLAWWLASLDSWDEDLPGEPGSLKVLEHTFDHLGVGVKPTPSSEGRHTMRFVYECNNLGNHTALPLACENYLDAHDFGGIVVTNGIGSEIPLASQMDMSSSYVSTYDVHPDGTVSWFSSSSEIDHYATWFAQVQIFIPHELALGVFPVRKRDKSVYYPTKKGQYKTYLWKEDAELAIKAGCEVSVIEGWGWPFFTKNNQYWAEWIYNKRISSPSKEVEKKVKKIAVAAIGSMGRSRDVFTIVGPNLRNKETDRPLLYGEDPLDLWIHPDVDRTSAVQKHWNSYTVRRSNRIVREFALPYAESGKLLLIDYDSVFTLGDKEGENFIHRNSVESLLCKPGTWLYKLHHNFRILRNRMWISDEEPSRYGSLLRKVI